MATLSLIGDDGSTADRYEIRDRPVVVGRGDAADVKVKDDALSRQHFVVLREDGEYLIEDLNSRNGTWLGGRRILAARLHHNDCILAGQTRFRFSERRTELLLPPMTTGPHGTVILAATGQRGC
jgi:pSer/pThr/pTyr-binding forkhead associated (FHA) protein